MIWHYKRRTRMLREKAGLPQLYDVDDLPDPAYDPNYVHVLSDKEQNDLHYRMPCFSWRKQLKSNMFAQSKGNFAKVKHGIVHMVQKHTAYVQLYFESTTH